MKYIKRNGDRAVFKSKFSVRDCIIYRRDSRFHYRVERLLPNNRIEISWEYADGARDYAPNELQENYSLCDHITHYHGFNNLQ